MTYYVHLSIEGHPATQGSKRHVGGGRLVEMDKKLPGWRRSVVDAAAGVVSAPLDGPLSVSATFYLPRPKRPKYEQPATPGDLDKYQRALGDALTIAGVIVDDARIVHWDARKAYHVDGFVGAVVTVTPS